MTLISIPGSGRKPSNPFLSLNSFLEVKVLIEKRSQLLSDRRLSEMPAFLEVIENPAILKLVSRCESIH